MKVPYGEGVASHTGPESCVAAREGVGEALTGVRAGRPSSLENLMGPGCRRRPDAGGRQDLGRRHRETPPDPAWSENPCTHASTSRENRESPWSPVADGAAGRIGKSKDIRR